MDKQTIEAIAAGIDFGRRSSQQPAPDVEVDRFGGRWHILILERGWVVVGKCWQEGQYIRCEDGSVIRRWGTTKGLGELASEGPRLDTKLDPIPTLRVHELRLVGAIECTQKAWK